MEASPWELANKLNMKWFIKAIVKGDLARLNKHLSRAGLYEFLESAFDQIESGESVLSIGAGGGVNQMLGKFQSKTDFTLSQLDIDESRGPDIVGDLCSENLALESESYDIVVCSEVLEHCYNPITAVSNLRRVLKKGGKLILTTPFIFPIHEAPHDYFRYTEFGLKHLLKDFSTTSIETSNSYPAAMSVLLVRYNGHGTFGRWASTLLAYMILPLVKILEKRTESLGTTRYLATARK